MICRVARARPVRVNLLYCRRHVRQAGRACCGLRVALNRKSPTSCGSLSDILRGASAMRRFFYQANFCAECGNALRQSRAWWPRYFCGVCARQMQRRSSVWRWFAPFGLLLAILSLIFATRDGGKSAWSGPVSLPIAPVSAFDAAAQPNTPPVVAEQQDAQRVLCGARTRRGTPCRRLVQPGQRCPQHLGQPSMLNSSLKD